MFDPVSLAAIALKTSSLLVVAALIASLMARRSAAWRHALWAAALILSLLMPVAVIGLPSYLQVALPWQAADMWERAEPAPPPTVVRRGGAAPEAPGTRQVDRSMQAREARAEFPVALAAWLLGAIGVLLRQVIAHAALFRWARSASRELSPAWTETLRRVSIEAGARSSLRVLESDRTASPCTWGLVPTVLLLPACGAGWPESQRRFALLHELAHVRRFDYLTTQLANLACAVHWYNPLVWLAAAQARKLQEQACDDAVLNAGGKPSDYAQFLVGIADAARGPSAALSGAVGMVRHSQLHGRVTAILDASRARLPVGRLMLLVALAPLAGLMLVIATVSATESPVATQAVVPLSSSFSAIELRNGGKVALVHGESQRVTFIEGDPQESGVTIRDDGRLVIDRCAKRCSRQHDLDVQVVTPGLAAIAVAEGGTIQSRSGFPPQPKIALDVSQGGTIDLRSIPVASVTASVYSGGRIFTKPTSALSATIEQGGGITYWGDAAVESSIRHGGAVVKGSEADADRPLAELGPETPPPVPPVPAVPPVLPERPDPRARALPQSA
jgi:beta-lactamase regulating signal transducer with metallopeptidase domain